MPFIDSIGGNNKKGKFKKQAQPAQSVKQDKKVASSKQPNKSLMWLIVGILISLIFLGWFFLLTQGLLSPNSNSKGWDRIKENFQSLIKTFKGGLDKSTEEDENLSPEEKKIRELEKKVFPQFENTEQK